VLRLRVARYHIRRRAGFDLQLTGRGDRPISRLRSLDVAETHRAIVERTNDAQSGCDCPARDYVAAIAT